MKKILFGILCLFAMSTLAQDVPKFETYLGYTFARMNSGINVPAFSANGGMAEIVFNFNNNIAIVGSFPAVHNGNIDNFHIDQTTFGYMFGPRGSLRFSRIVPSFESLFGATHVSRSFRGTPVTLAGNNTSITLDQRLVNDANAFSMLIGGNLDLVISEHLTFRPIKLDYYMTRFQPIFIPNLGNANRNRNQSDLLYSTGFSFRF